MFVPLCAESLHISFECLSEYVLYEFTGEKAYETSKIGDVSCVGVNRA